MKRCSDETIAARATPAGTGSIAVVRMSGSQALAIAGALFRPSGGGGVGDLPDRTLTLGELFGGPEATAPVDECLLALWRAPHSYTGEDVAEFQVHGGPRIVEAALDALFRHGARPADPGEFTRRAFVNGRMDLVQAEAVCDLIAAQTGQAARCALAQLAGGLSQRVESVRGRLVSATAEIEAFIDFPEEDLPDADRGRLGGALESGLRDISLLLADARRGRPLREGARIAIAGRPNAGKSSLLNALIGRERAIVAPHPGTTRDTIEAEVDLRGIPTLLVDMAGLREKPEAIEALGIERARQEIAAADFVVFLLDGSIPIGQTDLEAFCHVRDRPHVIVINKNDLPAAFHRGDVERQFSSPQRRAVLSISAKTRDGVAGLERELARGVAGDVAPAEAAAGGGFERGETPLVANTRHIALLESAADALRRASEGLAGRLAFELAAVDLRDCLDALGAITGHADLSEDILDAIFSRFCIGK